MPERIPGDRHGKIKFTKIGKTANNSTKIQWYKSWEAKNVFLINNS